MAANNEIHLQVTATTDGAEAVMKRCPRKTSEGFYSRTDEITASGVCY